MAHIERPGKSAQDQLDAAICAILAHHWHFGPADANLMLGDLQTGFIAPLASPGSRGALEAAAAARGIACQAGDLPRP